MEVQNGTFTNVAGHGVRDRRVRCVRVWWCRRGTRRRRGGCERQRSGDGRGTARLAFSPPSAQRGRLDIVRRNLDERRHDLVRRKLDERRHDLVRRNRDVRRHRGLGRDPPGYVRALHRHTGVLQRRQRGSALLVQRGRVLRARPRPTAHVCGRLSADTAHDHQCVGRRWEYATGRVRLASVACSGPSRTRVDSR